MLSSQEFLLRSGSAQATARRWPERPLMYLALVIADAVAVGLGLILSYLIRFHLEWPIFYEAADSPVGFYLRLIILFIPAWIWILALFKLYDLKLLFGGLDEYSRLFNACTTAVMCVMVGTFFFPHLIIARGWLLLSWFSVTALAGVGRFSLRRLVYRLRKRGFFVTRMLIVGADEEGKAVAEQLVGNPTSGVQLLGFVDDKLSTGAEVLPGLHVLGSTDMLRAIAGRLQVCDLTISSSALSRESLLNIFHTFGNSDTVNIRLSSGLFEIMTTGLQVKSVGQVPLLSVNRVRLTGAETVIKAVIDYVGATLGLLFLSPLFAIIAIAIKLDSPGPVFHRRRVMGVGGKRFDAFKFRTMVENADDLLERDSELKDEYERNFKIKDDPRVTPIGRFLRKTSLDELPQLINVLQGEMGLVGPRMIVEEEMEKYGKWGMNLLTVKPGITGLWQVNGRSDVDYEDRVRLDMHYIRNYTIWYDVQILFQTIPAVLRKKGAY
jgi:exopolysaccharide biosynthesis polyprenyl glycosylphosphotransferase